MNKKMKVVAITNDHKVEVKEVRRPDVKPDVYKRQIVIAGIVSFFYHAVLKLFILFRKLNRDGLKAFSSFYLIPGYGIFGHIVKVIIDNSSLNHKAFLYGFRFSIRCDHLWHTADNHIFCKKLIHFIM